MNALKRLLLLLLAVSMLCSGCSSAPEQQEEPKETMILYQALPLPDLFIQIPEHYQKTSSKAYKEYYVLDDASIIITEDTRESYYPSARDYAVKAIEEYEKSTVSFQLDSNEIIESGCAFEIQTLEFHYTIGQGETLADMTCLVGYMTDSHSMYIITCKSKTETYPSHKEEFLQAMHTAVIDRGET